MLKKKIKIILLWYNFFVVIKMLIDTHCHLNEDDYDHLDELLIDIFNNDIKAVIVSGSDIKSSNEAVSLAHKYERVYATVGFHPHDCEMVNESSYTMFDQWLADNKVVGIGEIGLDYFYHIDDKDKQKEMFERQVDIAIQYNKPIVVHNREASEDVYNILKDKKVEGVIHCFNDDLIMAKKFMDLGFYLGIGGIITFKKNNLKNVIVNIPIEYIVLETDSPYLSPEPYRGRKNNPMNLALIAKSISEIKKITYKDVVLETTSNAKRLFDLKDNL